MSKYLIPIACSILTALAGPDTAPRQDAIDRSRSAAGAGSAGEESKLERDAEALRRLLGKQLAAAKAGELGAARSSITELYGNYIGPAAADLRPDTNRSPYEDLTAFVVPGVGIVIHAKRDIPLEGKPKAAGEEAEPAHDDEWERAVRAVEGAERVTVDEHAEITGDFKVTTRRGSETTEVLDYAPNALEDLQRSILAVLGRFGGRVEGLGADESIIVLVELRPGSRRFALDRSDGIFYLRMAERVTQGNHLDARAATLDAPPARSHLVIQVGAAALRGAQEEADPAAHAAKHARITRY